MMSKLIIMMKLSNLLYFFKKLAHFLSNWLNTVYNLIAELSVLSSFVFLVVLSRNLTACLRNYFGKYLS